MNLNQLIEAVTGQGKKVEQVSAALELEAKARAAADETIQKLSANISHLTARLEEAEGADKGKQHLEAVEAAMKALQASYDALKQHMDAEGETMDSVDDLDDKDGDDDANGKEGDPESKKKAVNKLSKKIAKASAKLGKVIEAKAAKKAAEMIASAGHGAPLKTGQEDIKTLRGHDRIAAAINAQLKGL